jgi:hypothetical protein
MKRITRTLLAIAAIAALAALSASSALAGPTQGQRGLPEDFVPGVTDFPVRPPVFVPGVTDFPVRPAIKTPDQAAPRADGFDWTDAGIVLGSVAILALIAAAGVAVLRRRSKAIAATAALGVAVTAASAGGALALNHNETVLRG